MNKTQDYLQQHLDRFTQELLELLRIPSISADPAYQKEVLHCAEAVAKHLTKIGMEDVEIIATKGHPIVFGQKTIDPKLPTVLVYGHYDVQPADPLDLWHSPLLSP